MFVIDPKSFDEGLVGSRRSRPTPQAVHQTGVALASRALAYGTLYAVAGCSVIFYGIWKISGAKDFADFRQKAGSILPKCVLTGQVALK